MALGFSPHIYNTLAEMDRVTDAVSEIVSRIAWPCEAAEPQGACTVRRMKRRELLDCGTASRTTSWVSVSCTTTVCPGPEFQVWRSLETSTV